MSAPHRTSGRVRCQARRIDAKAGSPPAIDFARESAATASVPTVQPVDLFDLTDLLTDAANPTAGLITVTINPNGTASFALPRAEVGQGITTAVAAASDAAGVAEVRRRPVRLLASPVRSWLPSRSSTSSRATGRQITDADIDSLRNICRRGTYARIREAIVEAAPKM